MKNALCKNDVIQSTIDSREVAEMTGKEHSKLLRDIRNYCNVLNEAKIGLVEFFCDSTYKDGKGEDRPCYMLTKKGCDMVANKMTGEKGIIFTAKYVTRFEEMEQHIKQQQPLLSMEDMMIAQLQEHKKMREQLNQVNHNALSAVNTAERVEEKLDKQMTINATQQKHIQDAVKKKVSERLKRCAEFDHSFDTGDHKAQFFSSLYGDLKRRFGVPTYRDILFIDYEDALSYVNSWVEPAEIR